MFSFLPSFFFSFLASQQCFMYTAWKKIVLPCSVDVLQNSSMPACRVSGSELLTSGSSPGSAEAHQVNLLPPRETGLLKCWGKVHSLSNVSFVALDDIESFPGLRWRRGQAEWWKKYGFCVKSTKLGSVVDHPILINTGYGATQK